jgi:NAD(P)-dependent dehydrogenase (short-subunit alcohol dehydrogenase family)
MRLRGKVALVTGAQQGIGRGIALAFAHEGADVAVNYLDDRAAAETVLRQVQAAGRRATLVSGDVARPADAKAMVARVADELGGLDILVNNAGVYPRVPFLEMRESDWDLVLDVNLKGGFFCAQAAAQTMIAGRRRGAVINMASQAIRGAVRGVHYSASKGGVVAMTRAMALELAPHGIRVNAIAPTPPSRATAAARKRSRRWEARSRWGAWLSPTTSRPWRCFSPATTRATSRGRRSTSTADRTCRDARVPAVTTIEVLGNRVSPAYWA